MTLRLIRPLALLAFGFVLPHAHAADAPSAPALPTADISVESSRSAPNDLFRAQIYAEATDTNPGDVARKVNAIVTQAISTAMPASSTPSPATCCRTGSKASCSSRRVRVT